MMELRYGLRSLIRARWFTAAAILTFGLGIGINIAAFSVLDRMLFRSLPYKDPDSLVLFRECPQTSPECGGSLPAIVPFEARERRTAFVDVAIAGFPSAYSPTREQTGERPLRLYGVSPNVLRVLGVQPRVGRDFSDEDARLDRAVALISHESWVRRFASGADVVGREIWTRTSPVTIIGILPAGFIPPTWTAQDPGWDGLVLETRGWAALERRGRVAVPVARLAPGITPEIAQQEVDALLASLKSEVVTPSGTLPVIRVDPIQKALFSRFRPNFWLILSAAVLLLLLACANLATLLVARGRSREREAGIRAAIGASPRRLMTQALVESVLVCVAGALMAVAVLKASSAALIAVLPPLIARYASSVTDVRVLAIALAAALLSAMVAGVVPAIRASRVDTLTVLNQSASGRRSRLRGGGSVLAVESALAVVLVLSALMVVQSFNRLSTEDIGFDPAGLRLVAISRPARQTPEASLSSYRQVLDVLRELPGVTAVAGADSPAGSTAAALRGFAKDRKYAGGRYEVTADYFDVLHTSVIAGRSFSDAEVREQAPVAILSVSGSRAVWPDASPADVIGRPLPLTGEPVRQVVGVTEDLKRRYGDTEAHPALFVPLGAEPASYGAALVRLNPAVRLEYATLRERIVERIGPVSVTITSVEERLGVDLDDPRFRSVLLAMLALTALLLAALGLYAVANLEVRQREHEMGVRLSLGATGGDLRRLVIAQACRPVIAGIVLGFAGAYWTTKFLQRFLYQVNAGTPWYYLAVAAMLLATAVLAVWLPAWRASRVDPAVVLRTQ